MHSPAAKASADNIKKRIQPRVAPERQEGLPYVQIASAILRDVLFVTARRPFPVRATTTGIYAVIGSNIGSI